jgi:hypothetical protein
MKFATNRYEIVAIPENAQETAYLEDTLGVGQDYLGAYTLVSVRCSATKGEPIRSMTEGTAPAHPFHTCQLRAGHAGKHSERNIFKGSDEEWDESDL